MEKILKGDELEIRRQKNIEYQNVRKERLSELGKNKVSIRLDDLDYEKLADLCESLGYKRPKLGGRNLIETYSGVMKYLLRNEQDSDIYRPKSPKAQELFYLYKLIIHLKYDMGYSEKAIIERFNKDEIKTPFTITYGGEFLKWKVKDIQFVLNENILLKKLASLDKEG
ncbi:hypothetical protein AB4S63_004531 [Salmonella enterica]|nr:hypothetical protein [Salmonella enterica]EHD6802124.1 hypothetical protein [Salmonella enterica]EIO1538577.1 hypothetical protein [Salmonella enterica]EIO1540777.1 hypothetical protein [Salmonella enterica]EIQ2853365.1 hypothetical protein [Salmonella enterica]